MAASKLQLEAVQTVMPLKPTDPRQSVRVHLDENPSSSSGIFRRCFNVVLYYNKKSTSGDEEDSGAVPCGSLVAGWIKESLGQAFSEQPMFAGRLRPDHQDGSVELEIVSNDSGVRLIEAQFGRTLSEVLDLKENKEAEAELVFWNDLDHEQNPQFSPLFYVQVTNFTCGGYSIGISCSLLLSDPFAIISFLKRWTEIHIGIVSKTGAPKLPIFYRPYHRKNGASPALPFGSNTKSYSSQSIIFTISTKTFDSDSDAHEKFAALCIDEAELKLGRKTAPNMNFSVLKKEASKDVKVTNFTREGMIQKPSVTVNGNGIGSCATWDDLGDNEICFQEGNKPVNVSCWINSVPDEGFLMIIPSPGKDDSGMEVVITLPV